MWPPRDRQDVMALALLGVSVAALMAGFMAIGGPGMAREKRLDQMRMDALTVTAQALNCYRRGAGPLPASLGDVQAEIQRTGSTVRQQDGCWTAEIMPDPETRADFELEPVNDDIVRLCANFLRPSRGKPYGYAGNSPDLLNSNADRKEAGRFCYDVNLLAGQPQPVPNP